MSRNNYIYIDFENVQDVDFGRLAGKPAHVTLVLGERHKALPIPLVRLIQQHASQVTIIETGLNGKNALDFVLACEVGMQTEKDARGYFHILSGDKGFDALIRYLKGRDIYAARRESFAEIPALMNAAERLVLLTTQIKVKKPGLPRKRKALEAYTQATFGRALSAEELDATIQGLIKASVIEISDADVVSYGTDTEDRQ